MLSRLMFIAILPIIAFSLNVYAQADSLKSKLPYKEGKIVFERIVEVPGIKKQTLYAASKKWISDSFKNGKAVTQSEDESTGQIIGWGYGDINIKGSFLTTSLLCKFSLQINCKDEKYRIRFYNLYQHRSSALYISEFDIPLETPTLVGDNKNEKFNTDDDVYGNSVNSKKFVKARIAINDYFNKLLENFRSAMIKASSDEF